MSGKVDLLKYQNDLIIEQKEGKKYIFCCIRKKLLVLQPEEIVRQLFLHYLINELGYSHHKIAVEKGLRINNLMKRYDILVYDKRIEPFILVECKSMYVNINQDVMDQVGQYNLPLKAKYLVLTNGKDNIFCKLNSEANGYEYLPKLPSKNK